MHHQPHQRRRRSPSRSSPTARPTWCRMARPLLADPDFVNKARAEPRRRDQHLHRLQPGLPRSHVPAQDRVLPGQPARLPRDRAELHAGASAEEADCRRRRRPGRPGRRQRCSPSAATTCDLYDSRQRDRRPVQHGQAQCRARKSSTRRCATSATSSQTTGVKLHLNTRVDAQALIQAARYDDVVAGHRRHAAQPEDSRPSRAG